MIQKYNTWYKSFTLIELLIVIVIIGILSVALIPKLIGLQGKARDTARRADIQQIYTALKQYEIDTNQLPSWLVCIWKTPWEECRPWYMQNPIWYWWDGGTWARALWSGSFDAILLQYLKSIPIDPSPNRSIWERYIYRKWAWDIHCSPAETINNGSRLARKPENLSTQPEYSSEQSDKVCSPGKWWCCSGLGCSGIRFCILQLN